MNTRSKSKQGERGVALVMAVSFLFMVIVMYVAIADRWQGHNRSITAKVDHDATFIGVESGLQHANSGMFTNLGGTFLEGDLAPSIVGIDAGAFDAFWANFNSLDASTWPDFDGASFSPQTIGLMPGVEYIAWGVDLDNDGLDNNGNGLIDDLDVDGEEGRFVQYSFARTIRNGELKGLRAAEVLYDGENVNVWENAIFAGAGGGASVIRGNVEIHGSVHILGDGTAGQTAISASLSGTSFIHNNYDTNSSTVGTMLAKVPSIDDGTGIDDLNANLRVKHGNVVLSGSSEVGRDPTSAQACGTCKETMDGVFVSDQIYLGNDTTDKTDNVANLEQTVHSDNGVLEGYDLGDAVPFPTYDDDRGLSFLDDRFLEDFLPSGDPASAADSFSNVYQGDLVITAGDSGGGSGKTALPLGQNSFYYNATTGELVTDTQQGVGAMPSLSTMIAAADAGKVLGADSDSTNDGDNFIYYDSTTSTLVVNGRVPIDGNLSFDAGPDDTITYYGKGTMLTYDSTGAAGTGDLTVNVNLVTPEAGADLDGDGIPEIPANTASFPDNLLGIMAENNFSIGDAGGASQLQLMGGFYAQGTIGASKQTAIMGTIVGEQFDFSNQVPEIFQVPALAEAWNEQQRMIGSDPILIPQLLSWRELNVRG